jgi:hypothetical protein
MKPAKCRFIAGLLCEHHRFIQTICHPCDRKAIHRNEQPGFFTVHCDFISAYNITDAYWITCSERFQRECTNRTWDTCKIILPFFSSGPYFKTEHDIPQLHWQFLPHALTMFTQSATNLHSHSGSLQWFFKWYSDLLCVTLRVITVDFTALFSTCSWASKQSSC